MHFGFFRRARASDSGQLSCPKCLSASEALIEPVVSMMILGVSEQGSRARFRHETGPDRHRQGAQRLRLPEVTNFHSTEPCLGRVPGSFGGLRCFNGSECFLDAADDDHDGAEDEDGRRFAVTAVAGRGHL